jgi:predicted RNA-binding protein YlqC (UPF0109 family)
VKDLILFVARSLVEHPDRVEVIEVQDGPVTVYELRVDPDDIGKVIGREGRIIRAFRTLVKASAVKRGLRVTLDVV